LRAGSPRDIGGVKGKAVDPEADAVRPVARQALSGEACRHVDPLAGADVAVGIAAGVARLGTGDQDVPAGQEPRLKGLEPRRNRNLPRPVGTLVIGAAWLKRLLALAAKHAEVRGTPYAIVRGSSGDTLDRLVCHPRIISAVPAVHLRPTCRPES
jgi:hypothetical protein